MDYSKLTLNELYEVFHAIDRESFPERYAEVKRRIVEMQESPEYIAQQKQIEENNATSAKQVISKSKEIGFALIGIGVMQQILLLLTVNGLGNYYLYRFDFNLLFANAQLNPSVVETISYLLSTLLIIGGIGCFKKNINLLFIGLIPTFLLTFQIGLFGAYWYVQTALSLSFNVNLFGLYLGADVIPGTLFAVYAYFVSSVYKYGNGEKEPTADQ